jgi:hypothetical protein
VLDAIFSIIAVIGFVVGLILSYNHLFRMSFIFLLIKAYVELCVVSMFMKLRREKTKTPTPIDANYPVYEENIATAV